MWNQSTSRKNQAKKISSLKCGYIDINLTWLQKKKCNKSCQAQAAPLKSHKSRTTLVHHLIQSYFPVSRPGTADPQATHQASASSLPIWLPSKPMSLTLLLTFNALARACGQKRWQTKWCETWELTRRSATLTIAMSNSKNLKPRSRVKVQGEYPPKKHVAWYLYWNFPLALQVSEHRPPSYFFHLVSIPFQWRFWNDAQAWHLPNRTKVSQV